MTTPRTIRSTLLDRIVLYAAISLLPLMDHLPGIGGVSAAFVYFACLGVYILLRRPPIRLAWHPVFLAAAVFLAAGCLMESLHPSSTYVELKRFAQTIGAALIIAALCVDRGAMGAALFGMVTASLWLSFQVYSASYDTMAGAEVETFREAARLRKQAFEDFGLDANLNRLAFLCAQGVVVCLAVALKTAAVWKRICLLGAAVFCLLGTLLPQSRSAVLAAVCSGLALLLACRKRRMSALAVVALVLIAIVWIVPKAAMSRFQATEDVRSGKSRDSRVVVYSAALKALPEYVLGGVGAGHYMAGWAEDHGVGLDGHTAGAHNAFLQVLIFWGLPGLGCYLLLLWLAWRCLPRHCEADALALALFGLTVAMGMRLCFTHNFYVKDFALVLGLLVAARVYLWPRRDARPLVPSRRPPVADSVA